MDLEQRLQIAYEAICLELDSAREIYFLTENNRDRDADRIQKLETLAGSVDYFLGKGDPEQIEKLIEKGRERVISAQRLLNSSPNLVESLNSDTIESDSFPDRPADVSGGHEI